MKISSVNNYISNSVFSKKNNKTCSNNHNSTSFKGIYIDETTSLGEVAVKKEKSDFLPKDALWLNAIAQDYPNQDCFIRRGYAAYPRLEFRERPPVVQKFRQTIGNTYKIEIPANDRDYPCVPLLLYEDDNLNRYVGMTTYLYKIPSLPNTVRAGYELHKKLIEKKNEILDLIGKVGSDSFDIGNETVMQRAKREIRPLELAVQRYLLEQSFKVLIDRPSAKQIYASDLPKIQSRLDALRKYDLVTSKAAQLTFDYQKAGIERLDICKEAEALYPDMEENENRIKEIKAYLLQNKLLLG